MKENYFKNFINKINNLPLWMKHMIYVELKEDFEQFSSTIFLNNLKKEDLFQMYKPKLTFAGEKFSIENAQDDFYLFLSDIKKSMNIVEIAVKNKWSLAEVSSFFVKALNSNLIEKPESEAVEGTALYLNGNIRLGEYFVKLEKITIEQLDEALRTQRYIEESIKDKTGIAEILINLGFVKKSDTEGILLLKEDSKKAFFIEDDSKDLFVRLKKENEEIDLLKEQLNKSKEEKSQLKEQLKNLLSIEK